MTHRIRNTRHLRNISNPGANRIIRNRNSNRSSNRTGTIVYPTRSQYLDALTHFEDDTEKKMNELIARDGFFDFQYDSSNLEQVDSNNLMIHFLQDEIYTVNGDDYWTKLEKESRQTKRKIKVLRIANVTRIPRIVRSLKNLVHLVVIGLDQNGIEFHPEARMDSVRVLTLGLEKNAMPVWVQNLFNLEALFVHSHRYFARKLTFAQLRIPIWIKSLQNLKALAVSGPEMSSLARSLVGMKNLKYLGISGKWIRMLPIRKAEFYPWRTVNYIRNLSVIGELRELKILDLSFRGRLKTLPESFENLVNLESLNIEGSGLVDSPMRRFLSSGLHNQPSGLGEGSRLVPGRRLSREDDKRILMQLPALQVCRGIDYDAELFSKFLITRAKTWISRQGLSDPPRSLWSLILKKGASTFGLQSQRIVQESKRPDEGPKNKSEEAPSSASKVVSLDINHTARFLLLKHFCGTIFPPNP